MPIFAQTLASIELKPTYLFILILLICCESAPNENGNITTETELDTCFWQAKSLVYNNDTLGLELDHLIFRVEDTVTNSWSLKSDSLEWIVSGPGCLTWTQALDTVIFGIGCTEFPWTYIKSYTLIEEDLAYTDQIRIFKSVEDQYQLENGKILLERVLVDKSQSIKLRELFNEHPDTVLVIQ